LFCFFVFCFLFVCNLSISYSILLFVFWWILDNNLDFKILSRGFCELVFFISLLEILVRSLNALPRFMDS